MGRLCDGHVKTGRDKQDRKAPWRLYNPQNWMPTSNPGGGSLNGYDARNRLWRQNWHDTSGSVVAFEGGLVAKEMVLTGLWRDLLGQGKDALVRMTYSPSAEGNVRQIGEQSVDFGKTWQPSFDFTYKRRSK
ncbi:MAG: hypothetical protein IPO97_11085 [Sphingomonadales bacterium]|nr:hypothetical protein [Sphingomonadales bacterium]